MNFSPTLFTVRGIAIKVHATFLLLIAFDVWFWRQHGITGILFGVLMTMLLFVCVTLHELGHAFAAKSVGIRVSEILLLPIGGVAFLTSLPRRPLHEFWIAAAGPLMNVLITAVLWLVVRADAQMFDENAFMIPDATTIPSLSLALNSLFTANLMLVCFNLLPALPLDGGRMLRALLSMVVGERQGSTAAALIGRFIAITMAVIGFFSGYFMLLFVAYFIFIHSTNDQEDTRARTLLDTQRVEMAYNRHAIVLAPNAQLSTVVEHILTSYQPDFAVTQGNRLLGIVTRNDLVRALEESHKDEYVTAIMQRNVIRVEHTMTLDDVRSTIQSNAGDVAAVYRNEEFLGLVSLTDIEEAMVVIESVQNHHFLRATSV